jgi:hypothetical protein
LSLLRVSRKPAALLTAVALFLFTLSASADETATRYQCNKLYQNLLGDYSPQILEFPLTGVNEALPSVLSASGNGVAFRSKIFTPIGSVVRNGEAETISLTDNADFLKELQVGVKYNFAILDDRLAITKTGPSKLENWLSKHLMLRGKDGSVHYAGELWKDENGVLHINNASGTFKPNGAEISVAANLLSKNLAGAQVQGHQLEFAQPVAKLLVSVAAKDVAPVPDAWNDLRLEKMDTDSANAVYKAINGDGEIVAIFKGDAITKKLNRLLNERDLFSFKQSMEKRGLQKRSLVVGDLDKEMKLDLVPSIQEAETSEKQKGTLQTFLKGYETGNKAPKAWIEKVSRAQAQEGMLFDTLLGMADRHTQNWMVNPDGDLKLIDTDHILYLTQKIRWRERPSFQKNFPNLEGTTEPEVAKKFLSLTPERLGEILKERGLPDSAIENAQTRLADIQQGLRDGDPVEKIAKDNSILSIMNYRNTTAIVMGAAVGRDLYVSKIKDWMNQEVRLPEN